MTETYVRMGISTGTFELYMGLALLATPIVMLPIARSFPKPNYSPVVMLPAWGLWMIATYLLGLPSTIGMAGMPLMYAVTLAIPVLSKQIPLSGRFLLAGLLVVLTVLTGRPSSRGKIILGPVGATFTSFNRDREVDRTHVRVDASLFLKKDPPGHYSYNVMTNEFPLAYLGDNDIYWGPHGFATSKQVAERIASWSGKKIEYTDYKD